MIVLLDEDMVGASTCVGYPNLIGCVGVSALLSNGWIVGAHSTRHDDGAPLCSDIWACIALINQNVLAQGIVDRLYLTGGIREHPGGPATDYPQIFQHASNGAMAEPPETKFFDTSRLKRTKGDSHGFFVLITSRGAGQTPLVQYKRDSKMQYANMALGKDDVGAFNAMGFWYKNKFPWAKAGAIREGTGTAQVDQASIPKFHTAKIR